MHHNIVNINNFLWQVQIVLHNWSPRPPHIPRSSPAILYKFFHVLPASNRVHQSTDIENRLKLDWVENWKFCNGVPGGLRNSGPLGSGCMPAEYIFSNYVECRKNMLFVYVLCLLNLLFSVVPRLLENKELDLVFELVFLIGFGVVFLWNGFITWYSVDAHQEGKVAKKIRGSTREAFAKHWDITDYTKKNI